jgi:hypothetical protein
MSWEKFLKIKKVAEFIIAILGLAALVLIPLQIKNLQDTQNKQAFDLMMNFDNQLNDKENSQILSLIDSKKPLFRSNGGITNQQLDRFLNIYEGIASVFEKGLIGADLVCTWYGDDFDIIISNKEVVNYINTIRKDDHQYYEQLEKTALKLCDNKCLKNCELLPAIIY